MRNIFLYLQSESRIKRKIELDIDEWTFVIVKYENYQNKNVDCGILINLLLTVYLHLYIFLIRYVHY